MLSTQERTEYILSKVENEGSVRVCDLSRELDCSEVTVRNDLRRLDHEGLVRKIHGGAEARSDGMSISFEQGELLWHKEEKTRIAEHAFSYIRSRDSIIIDDSTTGYYLAKVIRRNPDKHLIVVTNSLVIAAELAPAQHIELFVLSGKVVGMPPCAMDNFTIESLRQFNVNKAFVGVNGINLKKGLGSLGAPHRDVKKAMIAASDELYVLADHTKFAGSGLFFVCPMDEVTRVITDNQVSPGIREQAKSLNIALDIA